MKAEYFFKYPFYSQTSNHPQEDLAKFGYRLDMKAENPVVQIWQFFKFFFPKICRIRVIFFSQKKSFVCAKIIFFRSENSKKSSPKKQTHLGHT